MDEHREEREGERLSYCRTPGVEHEWRKTYDGRRFSIWKCRRCKLQVTDADMQPRSTHG